MEIKTFFYESSLPEFVLLLIPWFQIIFIWADSHFLVELSESNTLHCGFVYFLKSCGCRILTWLDMLCAKDGDTVFIFSKMHCLFQLNENKLITLFENKVV